MEYQSGAVRAWMVAFAAVGLLQACGGGGGGSAPPPPPPAPPPPPPGPVITAQPTGAFVLQDGTATFTVAALNATAYQWQQSLDGTTWTDVAGANAATLSAAEPLAASGLNYRAVVSGGGGQATTDAVSLYVYPVIGLQPSSTVTYSGGDTSFYAGPTYDIADTALQWQESRDGQAWTDVSGETAPQLILHHLSYTDSGLQVRLVVSAFGHTYKSNVATVTVNSTSQAPAFVVQPLDATVAAGGDARFSSWIWGNGDLSYQWQSSTNRGAQWNAIPGANLQVLTMSGVPADADGALVRLQVTSDARPFFSQTATLHVGAAGAGRLDLLAGAPGGTGDLDGSGTAAWLQGPGMPAFDAQGNLLVLDNTRFKRIGVDGRVTTLAGHEEVGGYSDGAGAAAMFIGFLGNATVVAPNGDAYVLENQTSQIRKIAADGTVSTFFGQFGSDTAGVLNQPRGMAIDQAGNLYVADTGNHVIRRITPASVVSTIAGTLGVAGSTDGAGGMALLNSPWGIAVDPQGQVVTFTDGGNTVRQWTAGAGVTTLAGAAGASGAVDATGAAARFNQALGIARDASGNLYVVDAGNATLRKVTPAGVVSTLAGTAGARGNVDATGSAARFSLPSSVARSPDGSLAVVDGTAVRRVSSAGVVTTLAGSIEPQGGADGPGSVARFDLPRSVIVDAAGNLVVGDGHGLQRRVARDGTTTTFDTGGFADAMAFDGAGNLIVADGTFDCVVRRVSPQGAFVTVAGDRSNCHSVDGHGTQAGFATPQAVAVAPNGDILVMDGGRLRRIATSGDVTTLTSTDANVRCDSDGALSSITFCGINSMVIDEVGNLFVTDGNRVRRVDAASQQVTTIAGSNGLGPDTTSLDGNGTNARFDFLAGITRDTAGNLYVSDREASNVRRIDPAGNVTTLVGRAGVNGIILGTAPALARPQGLAMMDSTHLAILSMDTVLVYTLPGGTPLAATLSRRAHAAQAARSAAQSKGH